VTTNILVTKRLRRAPMSTMVTLAARSLGWAVAGWQGSKGSRFSGGGLARIKSRGGGGAKLGGWGSTLNKIDY